MPQIIREQKVNRDQGSEVGSLYGEAGAERKLDEDTTDSDSSDSSDSESDDDDAADDNVQDAERLDLQTATTRPQQSSIRVFLRIRPTRKPSGFFNILDHDSTRVDFNVPTNVANNHVNNTKSHYKFKFDGVLTQEAKQETVFKELAEDAIEGALDGYNATIFAYGQTGTSRS
jgi:hypothetical protein